MSLQHKPISREPTEASPIKQVFIGIVDVVLALLLVIAVQLYQTPHWLYNLIAPVNGTVLVVAWLVLYRLLMLLLFNGTIGMKLFRTVLLNGEMQRLTFLEKLLAAVFILYRGVDYYNVEK